MGMFDDILDNVGEPYKGGKGFAHGTHTVMIGSAEAVEKKTKNDPKAAVIEVVVFNPDDEEQKATTTLYFHTEGGAKMSLAKVLGLVVHSVGEEKKDKVRELGKKMFANVEDITKARDLVVKLMNDKLIGKEGFLVAEPRGKYKTTSYGDLWHYPAEPEGEGEAEAEETSDTPVGKDVTEEVGEDIPSFDDL